MDNRCRLFQVTLIVRGKSDRGTMDQNRNRPSRPRLRSHGNSARVLVFDHAESEESAYGVETDVQKRTAPPEVESKEAPARPG